MAIFAKGSIVIVPYPFSDLTGLKLRPALVLAQVSEGDYILCQITSKPYSSRIIVEIDPAMNPSSGLAHTSFARPEKLFTAHDSIIREQIGKLRTAQLFTIVAEVVKLIEAH
jgi:mRNA interferase MazF